MSSENSGQGEWDEVSVAGRVVIVTGANTGIGKETAKGLVKRGAHVFLACRDKARGEAAVEDIHASLAAEGKNDKGGRAEFMRLDLASFASVREFVAEFNKRGLPLHTLVNNGGLNGPRGAKTADGLDLIFGVNFVGHFLLTQLLLPNLIKAGTEDAPSRIVNLASVMHHFGKVDFENVVRNSRSDCYSSSKLAMILYAKHIQKALDSAELGQRVKTFSVSPGAVSSDIWRNASFSLNLLLKPIASLAFLDTEQGSRTSVYACTTTRTDGSPYIVPYKIYFGMNLLFETMGPYGGCNVALPAIPAATYDPAAHLYAVALDASGAEDVLDVAKLRKL